MPRAPSPSRQALSDMHHANKTARGRRIRMRSPTILEPHVVERAHKVIAAMAVKESLLNPGVPLKKIIRDLGAKGKSVEPILELSRRMRGAYEKSRNKI